MQLKFRQIAHLLETNRETVFRKYAAHHSWVDQSTLILTICWQETGHSQTWKFYFHENTLTLIVTDGTKGMFELSGAVSDRNVRFADMIFDGAFR